MSYDVKKNDEAEQHVPFCVEFANEIISLEKRVHSCEEPKIIALDALKTGAAFYDGDWCGIIEGDLEMEAWAPVLWYDVESQGMKDMIFNDFEDTHGFERWIAALYACEPLVIPDVSALKETHPAEYAFYKNCRADSLIAVPFWKNPIGFMIARNSKRYNLDPFECGFLQALAFVSFSSVTEQKLVNRIQKALDHQRKRL